MTDNQHLVCLWQLQDIEETIADASPEELVDLHSKLVALSTDITEAVQSLIRTEKLKLLAEVRELLIDRIPVYDGDDSFGKEYQAGYNSMAHATRTMQLQQSAELTKLEAEL